ncbi:tigger transposable element-derived protein 2-like [Schistocerca gregaria]|uniref:tigger transposable element-derived protein 2-like n=1 Tax=Schistocerca gregaria TaxID=7010 RepID=UPI00211E16CA|nr:tigger transposable element-derived protein 2-like [Schistocerca gregaria]
MLLDIYQRSVVLYTVFVMSKWKHTTLTLKEKIYGLMEINNGANVSKLATEMDVGKATICECKKNRERERGIPLSRALAQKNTVYLNMYMNVDESFSANTGWFDRFKKCHEICQLTTGEKVSSDSDAAKEYLGEIEKIVREGKYSPQQIYNADKTGLNFRSLPTKSQESKAEDHAPGFKMCKDSVTLIVCSNAAGNHKLPLMLASRSPRPRVFKN